MRFTDLLAVGVRNLARNPVRSCLTITALAINSALFVALATLGLATRSAIDQQLGQDTTVNSIAVTSSTTVSNGPLGHDVQVAGQAGQKLDDSVVDELARLPHVVSVTPLASVWQLKSFTVDGSATRFVARASGVEPQQRGLFSLAAGDGFTGDGPHQVVLGHGYAQALGHEQQPETLVGRTVRFTTLSGYRGAGSDPPPPGASRAEQARYAEHATVLTARVVGVTTASDQDTSVFVPMAWAHQIATVDTVTDGRRTSDDALAKAGYASIVVSMRSNTDVRAATASIREMGYGAESKQQQIDQILQLATVMWIVLGAISLISMISAALGIVNTMLMTVSEQRYAIGVWRACGATRLLIVWMFMLQALVLGVLGGCVGTAVGAWASSRVNQHVDALLQAQQLVALPIDSASWPAMAAAVLATTALAVLAGLYPATKAARNILV